jgi:hypothetical protein
MFEHVLALVLLLVLENPLYFGANVPNWRARLPPKLILRVEALSVV